MYHRADNFASADCPEALGNNAYGTWAQDFFTRPALG